MKKRGFTLLEVLVAMAIFALAGIALGSAATEHLRSLDLLKTQTFAAWVASNRLTEVHLEAQWPPQENKKGNVEMAGQRWYWQQKVSKTADDNMRMVEVSVARDEAMSDIAVMQSTFVSNSQALQ